MQSVPNHGTPCHIHVDLCHVLPFVSFELLISVCKAIFPQFSYLPLKQISFEGSEKSYSKELSLTSFNKEFSKLILTTNCVSPQLSPNTILWCLLSEYHILGTAALSNLQNA